MSYSQEQRDAAHTLAQMELPDVREADAGDLADTSKALYKYQLQVNKCISLGLLTWESVEDADTEAIHGEEP